MVLLCIVADKNLTQDSSLEQMCPGFEASFCVFTSSQPPPGFAPERHPKTDHQSTSAETLELITTVCLWLKFKNNSNRRSLESTVPQHFLGSPTSGLPCLSICEGEVTGLPFPSRSAGLRAISRWARNHCNPQTTLHMPHIKRHTLSPAWSHQGTCCDFIHPHKSQCRRMCPLKDTR